MKHKHIKVRELGRAAEPTSACRILPENMTPAGSGRTRLSASQQDSLCGLQVTILNVNDSYVYIPDIPDGGAWQKLYKAKATYDKLNWFQVQQCKTRTACIE